MNLSGHLKKPLKTGHYLKILQVIQTGINFASLFCMGVDIPILNMIYIEYDIYKEEAFYEDK